MIDSIDTITSINNNVQPSSTEHIITSDQMVTDPSPILTNDASETSLSREYPPHRPINELIMLPRVTFHGDALHDSI